MMSEREGENYLLEIKLSLMKESSKMEYLMEKVRFPIRMELDLLKLNGFMELVKVLLKNFDLFLKYLFN